MIAKLSSFMLAALATVSAAPSLVAADEHDVPDLSGGSHGGRGVGPSPVDNGFAGSVGAQVGLLNSGEAGSGSYDPERCDGELYNSVEGGVMGYPVDVDEDAFEGVVRWRYSDSNERLTYEYDEETGRRSLREGGTWYERMCYQDGVWWPYPYSDAGCHGWTERGCSVPGVGVTECPLDLTCYFDAIDPEQLAEYLMYEEFEAMIDPPTPHFAPEDETIVNFETWMWVTDTTEEASFTTETISVPGMSLHVEATRGDFVWDMGDGNTVECDGTGIEPGQVEGDGSCNYSYERSSAGQPNHRYEGSVAVVWEGNYIGEINGDPVDEVHVVTAEEPFDLGVGEVQAVIIDGNITSR